MAKLCAQYQDSQLWKDVFALSETVMKAVAGNAHPLNAATAELAARIPATLAQATVSLDSDLAANLAQVLEDLVLLEHHAALTGLKLPPARLQDLKSRVITLIEEDDGDFYYDDED